jgi:hypothetical protein
MWRSLVSTIETILKTLFFALVYDISFIMHVQFIDDFDPPLAQTFGYMGKLR